MYKLDAKVLVFLPAATHPVYLPTPLLLPMPFPRPRPEASQNSEDRPNGARRQGAQRARVDVVHGIIHQHSVLF